MEALGAAASILAIAGAGLQISLKLIAFADQIGTAHKRIQDVGTDVSVTAGTLQELGELMKKNKHTRKTAGMFNPDQVQNIKTSSTKCKEIFGELKDILGKASHQLRGVYKANVKSHDTSPKIKLSKRERMKWPFLQPSMEPLQSALRDAKITLTVILQVVHLRHAHITASLDREEQRDLIRMIAAIRRQQLASAHGDQGGYKGLDVEEIEDSDSGNSSEIRPALEAWSVTPNTSSDNAFQNFLITPIPLSQQQIAESLKSSPQDSREIHSIIDSLSVPERDAIFGEVLEMMHFRSDDSTIRSISSQRWTGSHDLFGKVYGRNFRLIIERRVRTSKFSQKSTKRRAHGSTSVERTELFHSHRPVYDSSSDTDGSHRRKNYSYGSSPSPPPRRHGRRRKATAHSMPTIEYRRRRFSDGDWKRKQDIKEKKGIEEDMRHQHEWGSPDSQPWTEAQPASEASDDDLVKGLMAQYTNFELGEPLVQGTATPPPTYNETFELPRRDPRPY